MILQIVYTRGEITGTCEEPNTKQAAGSNVLGLQGEKLHLEVQTQRKE